MHPLIASARYSAVWFPGSSLFSKTKYSSLQLDLVFKKYTVILIQLWLTLLVQQSLVKATNLASFKPCKTLISLICYTVQELLCQIRSFDLAIDNEDQAFPTTCENCHLGPHYSMFTL